MTIDVAIADREYTLVDTGEAWIIQQPHDLLDRITQQIVDAYRVQSEIAAEHHRTLPDLTRVTVDVIATELPALTEAGITSLTEAAVVAPHTGEWAGTTPADVARELGQALGDVKFWVVSSLERLTQH